MFRMIASTALAVAVPLAPLAARNDPRNDRADEVSAEDAISATKQMYGPPPPTKKCVDAKDSHDSNEIVVCAKQKEDDAQFRVKSSAELDPDSRQATNDGLPRAPDVAGDGIFKGKGLSFGGAPAPAYILDFKLLPDTPDGSDADKIAKGEKSAD